MEAEDAPDYQTNSNNHNPLPIFMILLFFALVGFIFYLANNSDADNNTERKEKNQNQSANSNKSFEEAIEDFMPSQTPTSEEISQAERELLKLVEKHADWYHWEQIDPEVKGITIDIETNGVKIRINFMDYGDQLATCLIRNYSNHDHFDDLDCNGLNNDCNKSDLSCDIYRNENLYETTTVNISEANKHLFAYISFLKEKLAAL